MNREIKETINEYLNISLLKPKFIVDLDLRTSGLLVGKKSFMNLEITFFVENNIEFKSSLLRSHLQNLTSIINYENFSKNNYFKFDKAKKTKTIETT